MRDYCLGAYWDDEAFFTVSVDGKISDIDDPEANYLSRSVMQNATTILVNLAKYRLL